MGTLQVQTAAAAGEMQQGHDPFSPNPQVAPDYQPPDTQNEGTQAEAVQCAEPRQEQVPSSTVPSTVNAAPPPTTLASAHRGGDAVRQQAQEYAEAEAQASIEAAVRTRLGSADASKEFFMFAKSFRKGTVSAQDLVQHTCEVLGEDGAQTVLPNMLVLLHKYPERQAELQRAIEVLVQTQPDPEPHSSTRVGSQDDCREDETLARSLQQEYDSEAAAVQHASQPSARNAPALGVPTVVGIPVQDTPAATLTCGKCGCHFIATQRGMNGLLVCPRCGALNAPVGGPRRSPVPVQRGGKRGCGDCAIM